ncbi:MAG: MaoC/PaaZ C-terminal domain-containing protein [Peptoniphilaceae bacterium]
MYLEDYKVGDKFEVGQVKVEKEDIIRFAKEFDPKPFHIDEEEAKKSKFGKLFASGFHTLSLCWGQWVKFNLNNTEGVIAGLGLENVSWKSPVFANDLLTSTVIVEDISISNKKDKGVITFKLETKNQRDEEVLEVTGKTLYKSKNYKK